MGASEVGDGRGATSPGRVEVDIARSVFKEKRERFELAVEVVKEVSSEVVDPKAGLNAVDIVWWV